MKYFGGPQCTLFKFYPVFQQIDIPPHTLYCNFKLRSATYGIHVGRHLTVTGDMSNIHDIEVWGCAGDLALYEKQKLQMRMEMQAERNAKVKVYSQTIFSSESKTYHHYVPSLKLWIFGCGFLYTDF